MRGSNTEPGEVFSSLRLLFTSQREGKGEIGGGGAPGEEKKGCTFHFLPVRAPRNTGTRPRAPNYLAPVQSHTCKAVPYLICYYNWWGGETQHHTLWQCIFWN